MPAFNPNPGEVLSLFNEEFTVAPHPRVPSLAYAQEGGRGTIYKVCDRRRQAFALKVFKRRAQRSDQSQTTQRLRAYGGLRGLRAANRRVIAAGGSGPSDMLVGSLLMPWIDGHTWFDVLQRAKTGDDCLGPAAAMQLCRDFLGVVGSLEARGAAHTDVASGNVVVDLAASTVELIDLEEMYDADCAAEGHVIPMRTPGYSRRFDGASLWSAEGDRFAAAVLAAEILLLSQKKLSRLSCGECFFDPDVVAGQDASRYAPVFDFLKREHPDFWQVFERSWRARSLADCSRVEELRASVGGTYVPRSSALPTQRLELNIGRSGVGSTVRIPAVAAWRPLDIPGAPANAAAEVAPPPAIPAPQGFTAASKPIGAAPQTPATAPVTSNLPPERESPRESVPPVQWTGPPPGGEHPKNHSARVVGALLAAAVVVLLLLAGVLASELSVARRAKERALSDGARLERELATERESLASSGAALATAQRELNAAHAATKLAGMREQHAEFRLEEVISPSPMRSIRITNDCDVDVVVAIHYQPVSEYGWVTEGWWPVKAHQSQWLGVKRRDGASSYYLYAESGPRLRWQDLTNGKAVSVSSDKFFSSARHPLPAEAPGYGERSFFIPRTTYDDHVRLTCGS